MNTLSSEDDLLPIWDFYDDKACNASADDKHTFITCVENGVIKLDFLSLDPSPIYNLYGDDGRLIGALSPLEGMDKQVCGTTTWTRTREEKEFQFPDDLVIVQVLIDPVLQSFVVSGCHKLQVQQ